MEDPYSANLGEFQKRKNIERNRKIIGHYRSSRLGSSTSRGITPEDISRTREMKRDIKLDSPRRGDKLEPGVLHKSQAQSKKPPNKT